MLGRLLHFFLLSTHCMLDIMALLYILGALSSFPLIHAHMQMINPSPFRDPHSNRQNEPKDWNILNPLHADGSDFACKGYQWNTPWTPVATYEAGKTYNMELKGGATHGGGSCQLSMSFDRGVTFKVIKSIVGGCPDRKKYSFTIPKELGRGLGKRRTTGLFAWTWFNRVGNREMYMNCAVVDIVPKGASKRDLEVRSEPLDARDVAMVNAAAQRALASYPPLFVANLASVNDCITKETYDVVFDDPGQSIAFADGQSRSAKPSFRKGECTGSGIKSAGSSSSSSSPPPSSQGSSLGGNTGQWQGPSSSSKKCDLSDGQYHPECTGGSNNQQTVTASDVSGTKWGQAKAVQKPSQQVASDQGPEDVRTGKQPSRTAQKELAEYLASLYGGKVPSRKRDTPVAQHVHITKPVAQDTVQETVQETDQQVDALVPAAQSTSDDLPSRHHGDTTTFEALAQELADIAGEDGPNDPLFEELIFTPEHYDDYDDLYFTSRSATTCKHFKRTTATCASPNRWVKRGTCSWSCARKGRVVKREQKTQRIAAHLIGLERKVAKLVQLAEKKKHSSTRLHRRENEDPTPEKDLVPAPTSLARFLLYLDQLQDKVIECIRNIAAIAPVSLDRAAVAADSIDLPTPAQVQADNLPPDGFIGKRQLVPPPIESLPPYDWPAILGIKDNTIANIPSPVPQLQIPPLPVPTLPVPKAETFPWNSIPKLNPRPRPIWTNPFASYDNPIPDLTPGDVTAEGTAQAAWLAGLAQNNDILNSPVTPIAAPVKPIVATLPELVNPVAQAAPSLPSPSLLLAPPPVPSTAQDKWTSALISATNQNSPPLFPAPFIPLLPSPIALSSSTLPSPPPTSAPTPSSPPPLSPAAALFPYLQPPGPVIPPDLSFTWPGPNNPGEGDIFQPGTGNLVSGDIGGGGKGVSNLEQMPQLVNDLGPGSEEEVRKWFEELEEKYPPDVDDTDDSAVSGV
ncbi:hypothetical protein FB567DRAFT_299670 [Paraphoma chrysanthemicola]|uniref:Lytic polysaccharide monooxygenase n=1 Tax=Paraphoma chrysanthemicola TaxID=798071 RepID=A0A8K0W178_9PLEO|nr:hypothetical protein FB567DRAFT_299670 [Paraphoma chrysanthemicola]